LAACLEAAGIATTVIEGASGELRLQPDAPDKYVYCDTQSCLMVNRTDGKTEAQYAADHAALVALWEKRGAGQADGDHAPVLIIGSVDHTDALVRCLAENPYRPVPEADRVQAEVLEKERRADASRAWARCAREHGLTQTKDPAAPVADGWVSSPAALVAPTVTEAELLDVLEACPSAATGTGSGSGESPEAGPFIAIDYPGFRFDGSHVPAEAPEQDVHRLTDLAAIIDRAQFPDSSRDLP
jgi:hypothetical protein